MTSLGHKQASAVRNANLFHHTERAITVLHFEYDEDLESMPGHVIYKERFFVVHKLFQSTF